MLLERIFAAAFLLIGLSHLLQPARWVRFFERLHQTGVAGFIIAMFTLPCGLILITAHNLWSLNLALTYTIAGWSMTIKSALYLLFPTLADRMLENKIARSLRSFQLVGAGLAILGAILTWQAWLRP